MADKELLELPEVVTLTNGTGLYVVDGDGNSRYVLLEDLKTFVNTDPTIVPSSEPWKGARVRRTSDLTGVSTVAAITWQTASVDTDSFWSAGAPTRLTVPAGVSKVRLFWSIQYEALSTAGSIGSFVRKNGSDFDAPDMFGSPEYRNGTTGATANRTCGFSAMVDVDENDYFELFTSFQMSGQDQVLASPRTWFELEVLEAIP